jgi:hypothetical protein
VINGHIFPDFKNILEKILLFKKRFFKKRCMQRISAQDAFFQKCLLTHGLGLPFKKIISQDIAFNKKNLYHNCVRLKKRNKNKFMKHAEKLSHIDDKIKALQTKKKKLEEKQNVALVNIIKRLGVHNLPEEIVVGALIETSEAFEHNKPILSVWRDKGRRFLKPHKENNEEEKGNNPLSFHQPSATHP